jgi:hypothetical protein
LGTRAHAHASRHPVTFWHALPASTAPSPFGRCDAAGHDAGAPVRLRIEASPDGRAWAPQAVPRWAQIRTTPAGDGGAARVEWDVRPSWEWVLDWCWCLCMAALLWLFAAALGALGHGRLGAAALVVLFALRAAASAAGLAADAWRGGGLVHWTDITGSGAAFYLQWQVRLTSLNPPRAFLAFPPAPLPSFLMRCPASIALISPPLVSTLLSPSRPLVPQQ